MAPVTTHAPSIHGRRGGAVSIREVALRMVMPTMRAGLLPMSSTPDASTRLHGSVTPEVYGVELAARLRRDEALLLRLGDTTTECGPRRVGASGGACRYGSGSESTDW